MSNYKGFGQSQFGCKYVNLFSFSAQEYVIWTFLPCLDNFACN